MEDGVATYTAEAKKCIVVIKNVPCKRCQECGEVLYQTEKLEKIDTLVEMTEQLTSEISVIDYSNVT